MAVDAAACARPTTDGTIATPPVSRKLTSANASTSMLKSVSTPSARCHPHAATRRLPFAFVVMSYSAARPLNTAVSMFPVIWAAVGVTDAADDRDVARIEPLRVREHVVPQLVQAVRQPDGADCSAPRGVARSASDRRR